MEGVAPPTHPFGVYFVHKDHDNYVQDVFVGGSSDLPTAVAIACAMYIASQTPSSVTIPDEDRLVAVYNEAGEVVAALGDVA